MHDNVVKLSKDIKCECCGKIVAKERDNKIYLWCKHCKTEIPLKIEKEPMSR